MTLAEKLKEARTNAGLTQAQLAEVLCVSRQAVTKWESGQGVPDIDNLKNISKALDVSVDFLLDDEGILDKSIIREKIDLSTYDKTGKLRSKRDALVYAKYADMDIYPLMVEKKAIKKQRAFDNILGFFTEASFGTVDIANNLELVGNSYYLVEDNNRQLLVVVTKEFIESKVLAKRIKDKKFVIDDIKYTKVSYKVEK